MNEAEIKKELCILVSHYLRQKCPDVYSQLSSFCKIHELIPHGYHSIDDVLNFNFLGFPPDQFYRFLQSLWPPDDFPSIFRRITKFDKPEKVDKLDHIVQIKRIFGHNEPIYCLSIDPLSRFIVTGADDCSIKLWSIPDLNPIHRFSGHEGVVTNCDFNPLCTYLLSSSHDMSIRIWSMETGTCLTTLSGFTTDIIHYAVFSPTGSMIAAACEDGSIPLWLTRDALQSSVPYRVIRSVGKGPVAWVSFSPGGEFLAYTCEPNVAMVIALKTMTFYQLELHSSLPGFIQFSKDYFTTNGEVTPRIFTASNDEGVVAIWHFDAATWRTKYIFKHSISPNRKPSRINKVAFDKAEHLIVISRASGIYVCDSFTGETVGTIDADNFDNCSCISCNPVHQEICFLANNAGMVLLADIHELKVLDRIQCSEDSTFIESCWSSDGEYIFATDSFGSVNSFRCLKTSEKNLKNYQIIICDMFESAEFNSESQLFFTDRRGKRLKNQPQRLDIRNLRFNLNTLQAPYLKNCAIEINLIQKLLTADRNAMSTSVSQSVIAAPPIHIRYGAELPVNPHGGTYANLEPDSYHEDDKLDEETATFKIESDTDDWDFEQRVIEEGPEENNPPLLFTNDFDLGVWNECVSAVVYDDSIYIPQTGDEAVVILTALKEMMEETGTEINLPRLTEINRVTVNKIEGAPHGLNLGLMTTSGSQNHIFQVPFIYPDHTSFIVPLNKYNYSQKIMKIIKVGDNIEVPFVQNNRVIFSPGSVTEISPNHTNFPYNSLSVNWGNEISKISPWEITRLNGTIIDCDQNSNMEEISYYFSQVLQTTISNNKYEAFLHVPDHKQFELYPQTVTTPMSLEFLLERLENGWYRSFTAIEHDLKLIHTNCIKFNSSEAPLCKLAAELVSGLNKQMKTIFRQNQSEKRTSK